MDVNRDDYTPHAFYRILEVGAVLATGAARFIVAEWLDFDLFFIVCAIAFWFGFVLVRTRSEPGVLRRWGFTWRWNSRQARIFLPYFAAVLAACFLWFRIPALGAPGTAAAGPDGLSVANLVTTLLLYPFWGVVQQFIVVAMIAGNIGLMVRRPSRRGPLAVLATGTLLAWHTFRARASSPWGFFSAPWPHRPTSGGGISGSSDSFTGGSPPSSTTSSSGKTPGRRLLLWRGRRGSFDE